MAYITAPDFRIRSIEWELDRPSQVNVSAYTARRSVLQNPWHGKWRAKVELAMVQGESEFRSLRSFFARCEGQVNVFRIYATVEAQNSNVGVTVASAAAAGATSLSINGAATPLTDGQYFTVNGQLCVCIADQSGSTLTFEPPLRAAAAAGTTVVTSRPYALVSMASSSVGWSVGGARRYGAGFSVEEAIGDADGTASELSPFASSDYKLALKFTTASYWANATNYAALSLVPGYSFTRSGEQGAVDSDDTIDYFAANAPAINGAGYHAYGALTNAVLESQTLDVATWAKTNCSIAANAVTSPDGTMTAETLDIGTAASVSHYIYQSITTTAAVWTYSVFAKAGSGRYLQLAIDGVSSTSYCNFDLVSGTVGSKSADLTGYIQAVGDFWRCIVTGTAAAVTANAYIIGATSATAARAETFTGSNQTYYVWQVQAIAGNFPDGGPIIRTTTAAASIGASALNVSDSPASGDQLFWSEADFTSASTSGVKRLALWDNGTTDNMVQIYKDAAALTVIVRSGAAEVFRASATVAGKVTVLLRRKGGDWRGGYVANGALTWFGADTAAAFPAGMTVARIGHYASGDQSETAVRGAFRKTGSFATDAAVLAAVAESD